MKMKSNAEIVKHPRNNHVWVHLANFINHTDDVNVDDINERRKERERRREFMEK